MKIPPPGDIDNKELERVLVIDERYNEMKRNHDYYLFTKEMWDFFFALYGGGPIILKNSVPYDQMSQYSNSRYDA